MAAFLKPLFPVGILLLILSAASLFFGADAPLASYVFSGALLLLAGAWVIAAPQQAALPQTLIVPVVLLAGFMALDLALGRIWPALPEYASLAAAGAVFLIARGWSRATDRALLLWQWIIIAMAVLCVWALVDFIVAPETIFGRERPWHENRLSMTFLSANTAASFLGIGVLLALSEILKLIIQTGLQRPLMLAEEIIRKAFPALVLLLIGFLDLILTASRAGLTFTLVSAAILILWEIDAARRKAGERVGKGLGQTLIVIAGIGAASLIVWGFYAEILGARTSGLAEDANSRAVMYQAYAGSLQQSPLIGHGLGSFAEVNHRLMTADNANVLASQGAAHNIELQWLMQAGIFGTAAMFGVMAVIIGAIWQGLSTRRRLRGNLRAIICVSLFIILHGQVDFAIEIPGLMWWWALLLGLGAGIADGRARPPKRPHRKI